MTGPASSYKITGEKPGPGRPKGSANKTSGAVKEMILKALDDVGGVEYLAAQAEKNPKAFLSLVGKVLPLTIGGDPSNPVRHMVDLSDSALAAIAAKSIK